MTDTISVSSYIPERTWRRYRERRVMETTREAIGKLVICEKIDGRDLRIEGLDVQYFIEVVLSEAYLLTWKILVSVPCMS